MSGAARYEVIPGNDGRYYWHLKSGNGEIVAQSEGYETEEHAREGIEAAERGSLEAHEVRVEGEEE